MPYPTVKTLLRITDGDEDKATELRAILTSYDRWSTYPTVNRYVRDCYHFPGIAHLKMLACDAVLETFGVEYAENEKNPEKSFEYCNTGDSYCHTLCCRNGHFWVAAWGDIVERWI